MGCFSWLTADSKKTIRLGDTAYLLQPGDAPPIEEPSYGGYGQFGEVDAHAWLAQHNVPKDIWAGLDDDEIRVLGISLESGSVLIDPRSGSVWSIYDDQRSLVGGSYFSGRWDEIMPGYDDTPNALVESGRLVDTPISDLFEIKLPLKFSFSPDARYEELPPSETCPDQGHG